jgi:hypothetical protein
MRLNIPKEKVLVLLKSQLPHFDSFAVFWPKEKFMV